MGFKIIEKRRPFGCEKDRYIPLEMLERWIEEEYKVSFSGSYKVKNIFADWGYGDEDDKKDYFSQGYRMCLSHLRRAIDNAPRFER